jgi:monovalent cation:H+ antiporter-2, CPA2 family
MVTDAAFFRDLAHVFVAAVLGAVLARLARQPLILGYVAGGILISPLTPGPSVSDIRALERFAEMGVILLMFSIGIQFSLRDLLQEKWVATVGGPLRIVLSTALGTAIGAWLGWPPLQGVVVGMVVSVASTMVLARLLLDRGELHSRHGRIMIGTALVEDLAVVVLIILVPRLGTLEPGRIVDIASGLGLALAIIAPILYLAAKVVPPTLTRVARIQSSELFLLVVLAIALGTAAVTQAVGLSLALGAFLAGLTISESDYAHETLARLLPLRDVFVALFFVTVGALVNPEAVVANLPLLGVMVGLVIGGKLVIGTVVVRLFGHPIWTALLVGVGLTQIGEFSFILVRVARTEGLVGDDVYNATLAAALLTILTNAVLVRYAPDWIGPVLRWKGLAGLPVPTDTDQLRGHVVICGFGRVGSAVADAFEAFDKPYLAIELNPDIVTRLRERGIPCLYGDASQGRLLEVAGADRASLVIVALPEMERAYLAVANARALNPTGPILARAHDLAARDRLIAAGATEGIVPEFEAASTLIRHALRRLALPRDRVLAYLERFRDAMEALPAAETPEGSLPVVREIVLDAGALTDQTLREVALRERFGVTVIGIRRTDGEYVSYPTADNLLRPGDRLRVFGLPDQIGALHKAVHGGQ